MRAGLGVLFSRCANCTCSFDKDNTRAIKLRILRSTVSSSSEVDEFSILEAISFIYEIPLNNLHDVINTSALKVAEDDNSTTSSKEFLTLAMCRKCAPLLGKMYKAHREFVKFSHPDSFLSAAKAKQRQSVNDDPTPGYYIPPARADNYEENFEELITGDIFVDSDMDEEGIIDTSNQDKSSEDDDTLPKIWIRKQITEDELTDVDDVLELTLSTTDEVPPFTAVCENVGNPGINDLEPEIQIADSFTQAQNPKDEINLNADDNNPNVSKLFICPQCGKTLKTEQGLRWHINAHKVIRRHQCTMCDKSFTYARLLHKHKRTHATTNRVQKQFSCVECGKVFGRELTLRKHSLTHKPGLPGVEVKTEEIGDEQKCNACGKCFKTISDLQMHLKLEGNSCQVTYHRCNICTKAFLTENTLRCHMLLHTSGLSSVNKPFICDHCGKQFANNSLLCSHAISHDTITFFECVTCTKNFKRHSHLVRHRKYHCKDLKSSKKNKVDEEQNAFICKECSMEFPSKLLMLKHVRLHMKSRLSATIPVMNVPPLEDKKDEDITKKFVCECGKRFTTKSHLIRHSREVCKLLRGSSLPALPVLVIPAEEENKFVCEKCSKQFNSNSHFVRHLKNCITDGLY